MFRTPLLVALALAIAFGVGIVTSVLALRATIGFGAIALGPWKAFPQAQTADADPYAKAHRAREGKLLLGGAEGLLFAATTDSAGRTLSSACSYEVTGATPPARLWTLHAASPRGRRLATTAGLPDGLTSWMVMRAADGSFVIQVSPTAKPGNWLAVPVADAPFELVLTLLDTPTAGSSGVIDLGMPAINRMGCADA
ncbi:DUF1214 domain-containing protein [Sinorhizobium sp. BG8]|uniref:DUF1214 domain-containing protein n=1 Tax=Sinorhizobium sp. BG8 TaxID=2613773 RepID=UPI00193DDAC0|nr:DUF1214 domain-containing protein [Sinorhizobium sp. BG8]QRM54702.1 DUF1214 domain-containing protein [Sinorhizobium sp. BG8]